MYIILFVGDLFCQLQVIMDGIIMGKVFFFDGSKMVEDVKAHKLVYHYTSPDGLFSILTNQRVRFTDCQFMNDKSEFVYTKNILKKALKIQDQKARNETIEELANLIMAFPYESIDWNRLRGGGDQPFVNQRYYLFCTTLKADNHNMWCYFMKNGTYMGYNLRFHVDRFTNLFTNIPDVTLMHGKVIYDEDEQIDQVLAKLKELDTQYAEQLEKVKGTPYVDNYGNEYDAEEYLGSDYLVKVSDFIYERGLFFKSPAFESEDEYRFVVKAENGQEILDLKLDHRVGNNGVIIPFRELNFDPMRVIDHIMLAPMMEKEIAKEGLLSLFRQYKQQYKIDYSSIDVRF